MALPEAAVASPLFHSEKKPDPLRQLGILSLNGMFEEMDGVSVLKQATEILPDDLAIVSSFGADSAVLLHMVAQVDKNYRRRLSLWDCARSGVRAVQGHRKKQFFCLRPRLR